MRKCRKPRSVKIGPYKNQKLYRAETKLHQVIKEVGEALEETYNRLGIDVLAHEIHDFHFKTLPQVFFDLLENYDRETGIAACNAFLAKCAEDGWHWQTISDSEYEIYNDRNERIEHERAD